jgi:hypothetical protein
MFSTISGCFVPPPPSVWSVAWCATRVSRSTAEESKIPRSYRETKSGSLQFQHTYITIPTELFRRRNREMFLFDVFTRQISDEAWMKLLASANPRVFSVWIVYFFPPHRRIKYSAVRWESWLSLCGHVIWACLPLYSTCSVHIWSCFHIPWELNLLWLTWTQNYSENILLH